MSCQMPQSYGRVPVSVIKMCVSVEKWRERNDKMMLFKFWPFVGIVVVVVAHIVGWNWLTEFTPRVCVCEKERTHSQKLYFILCIKPYKRSVLISQSYTYAYTIHTHNHCHCQWHHATYYTIQSIMISMLSACCCALSLSRARNNNNIDSKMLVIFVVLFICVFKLNRWEKLDSVLLLIFSPWMMMMMTTVLLLLLLCVYVCRVCFSNNNNNNKKTRQVACCLKIRKHRFFLLC